MCLLPSEHSSSGGYVINRRVREELQEQCSMDNWWFMDMKGVSVFQCHEIIISSVKQSMIWKVLLIFRGRSGRFHLSLDCCFSHVPLPLCVSGWPPDFGSHHTIVFLVRRLPSFYLGTVTEASPGSDFGLRPRCSKQILINFVCWL